MGSDHFFTSFNPPAFGSTQWLRMFLAYGLRANLDETGRQPTKALGSSFSLRLGSATNVLPIGSDLSPMGGLELWGGEICPQTIARALGRFRWSLAFNRWFARASSSTPQPPIQTTKYTINSFVFLGTRLKLIRAESIGETTKKDDLHHQYGESYPNGLLIRPCRIWLGPPVVPFYPFLGEGSPTKIDYRKTSTLIPTSLLEDLVGHETS